MIRILEDVFRTMIRKKYKTDDNFDITEEILTGLNEEYFEKYPPKNED